MKRALQLPVVVGALFVGAAASCAATDIGADDAVRLPPRKSVDAGEGGATDGGPLPAPTDGGTDAGVVEPPCNPAADFGTPVAITELNSAKEDFVADVSPDELTMYVGTNNKVAGIQLFSTKRATKQAAWGALVPLFPAGNWDNWWVSVNGNTAIVSSTRTGNSELFIATRPSPADAFGALTLLAGTSNPAGEEGPRLSADGKTLYFDSTRGTSRDLFRASIDGANVTNVAPITELNSPGLDAVPILTADELTIYFISDRAPATGAGDIFVARRLSKTSPFGTPEQVRNVNSDGLDGPGHISADGCTLYLSSTRLGTSDIYVARRPK